MFTRQHYFWLNISPTFRVSLFGVDSNRNPSNLWKTGNFGILGPNAAPGIFLCTSPGCRRRCWCLLIIETFDSGNPPEFRLLLSQPNFRARSARAKQSTIFCSIPAIDDRCCLSRWLFVNCPEKVLNNNYNLNNVKPKKSQARFSNNCWMEIFWSWGWECFNRKQYGGAELGKGGWCWSEHWWDDIKVVEGRK